MQSADKTPPRYIFSHSEEDGKHIQTMIKYKRNLTTHERMEISHTVPKILCAARLLTTAELETINYVDMSGKGGEPFYTKGERGELTFTHVYVSPVNMEEAGFMPEFAALRQDLLEPEFEEGMHRTLNEYRNFYLEQQCQKYSLTTSQQQYMGSGAIQMTELARQNIKGTNKDISLRLFRLASKLLEKFVPGIKGELRDTEWHRNSSLTFGGQKYLNAIQLNFTHQGDDIGAALKKKGKVHSERGDDEIMYSVLLFFTNYSEDQFPGRFNNTTYRTTVIAAAGGAYIFPARSWHFDSGAGPYPDWVIPGHPLRYVTPGFLPALQGSAANNLTRLNAVVYPKKTILHPTVRMTSIELWLPHGLNVFQDMREQQEWKLRMYIANEALFEVIKGLPREFLFSTELHPTMEWVQSWWKLINLAPATFYGGVKLESYAIFGDESPEQKLDKESQKLDAEHLDDWLFNSTQDFLDENKNHTDPDYFLQKFEWFDPNTGTTERPSRSIAVRSIQALADGEGEDVKQLRKDLKATFCGVSYHTFKPGMEGEGDDHVVWTHKDYNHEFDPATDTIPAKPGYKPVKNDVKMEDSEN